MQSVNAFAELRKIVTVCAPFANEVRQGRAGLITIFCSQIKHTDSHICLTVSHFHVIFLNLILKWYMFLCTSGSSLGTLRDQTRYAFQLHHDFEFLYYCYVVMQMR